MKRSAVHKRQRHGLSLLEMMIATATMATLMVSVVTLVRTGYGAWDAYENDLEVTDNAYGTLRHIVRRLRQAEAVTAISAASETSGNLSARMSDGSTYSWSHNSLAIGYAYFDSGSGIQLLAWRIEELSFIGYEADGITQTTTVGDIHLVEIRVKVTLPHGAGQTLVLSDKAWIRSW